MILIKMLKLRSLFLLVLLTRLVDSPSSLDQALFDKIKRTFSYAEVVIVVKSVAL